MKVLITGATGKIGSAILKHLLRSPRITSVTALSRRNIPIISSKLTTIIIPNLGSWEPTILSQLVSADAAVWAMGTTDANRDVNYNYPHAFLEAFLAARKDSPYSSERIRFIRVCGAFTERDQDRPLWFYSKARKLHGLSEARTLELGEQYRKECQTFVLKPGGVSTAGAWTMQFFEKLLGDGVSISDEKLGAFAADLVVNGDEKEGAILNRRMAERGAELLGQGAE
ncbi:hypothetical protein N0V90_008925 [Kalmusia sp. IMI 367209]|nr:hypothetical protein N0V90_008925 [Kalmusia sp. IMI 367209]